MKVGNLSLYTEIDNTAYLYWTLSTDSKGQTDALGNKCLRDIMRSLELLRQISNYFTKLN